MYCGRCGAPVRHRQGICLECGTDLIHGRIIEIEPITAEERHGKALAIAIAVVGLTVAYFEPQVLTLDESIEQVLADGIGALALMLSLVMYLQHSTLIVSAADE